jgi:hypothetical protein
MVCRPDGLLCVSKLPCGLLNAQISVETAVTPI